MIQSILDYGRLWYSRRFWNQRKIQSYQLKKIKQLVKYAKNNAVYYQKEYNNLSLDTLDDFSRFPIINKQILMDHFDEINTCGLTLDEVSDYAIQNEINKNYLGYFKDQFVIGLSSGTSGNRGLYITSKSLTKRLPAVFLARSGIPLRLLPFRIIFMLRVFSQGFSDINSSMISLKYLSTMTPIDQIIEQINTQKANILMAPPSLLRILLPYAFKLTKPLKMIVSYAEVLEDEEKARLVDQFGCRVIQIYQASEGQLASCCSKGELHINEDLVYVELLDEHLNPITDSNVCATKMYVTNLVNQAQPLIRYEMNDLVVLNKSCGCGSHFRVIKNIIGRDDDVFEFQTHHQKSRHVFPDLMSRWIITTSSDVREFLVIQLSKNRIKIVCDLMNNTVESNAVIKKKIADRFEKELAEFDIDCEIEIVFETIPLSTNKSKQKRFIKELTQ